LLVVFSLAKSKSLAFGCKHQQDWLRLLRFSVVRVLRIKGNMKIELNKLKVKRILKETCFGYVRSLSASS
jgi:hypothetical protein